MNSGRGGLNSTALALIPLAIAINIAVGQLVVTSRVLPFYLDSIGTVLVGALLGPWVGLITGALSNVIWTLTGLPNSNIAVWFAYVAAVIGLIAGFAGRAGLFTRESPRWLSAIIGGVFFFALAVFVLSIMGAQESPDGFITFPAAQDLLAGQPIVLLAAVLVGAALGYFVMQRAGYAGLVGLLTGVVSAIISAPMAAYVFGGVTGSGTDLLVAAFRASGENILFATMLQGGVSDPFDKMASFLLVWLIIQALPKRVRARFPNLRRGESAEATDAVARRTVTR